MDILVEFSKFPEHFLRFWNIIVSKEIVSFKFLIKISRRLYKIAKSCRPFSCPMKSKSYIVLEIYCECSCQGSYGQLDLQLGYYPRPSLRLITMISYNLWVLKIFIWDSVCKWFIENFYLVYCNQQLCTWSSSVNYGILYLSMI